MPGGINDGGEREVVPRGAPRQIQTSVDVVGSGRTSKKPDLAKSVEFGIASTKLDGKKSARVPTLVAIVLVEDELEATSGGTDIEGLITAVVHTSGLEEIDVHIAEDGEALVTTVSLVLLHNLKGSHGGLSAG